MVFVLVLSLLTSCTEAVATDHGKELVEWLRREHGTFHEALEIRRSSVSEKNYAMFATQNIPAGETLLEIPHSMVLTTPNEDACETVVKLAQELEDLSTASPYVRYLAETQAPNQLPSFWSLSGQELLLEMLALKGNDSTKYYAGKRHMHTLRTRWKKLPPEDPVGYDVLKDCEHVIEEEHTDRLQFAYQMVLQRGWDEALLPVFDMMSHLNGGGLNTAVPQSIHDSDDVVTVKARRDIAAGEEITTTYNFCEDCGNRYTGYGTAEIFRDYGFVEAFPQRWIFPHVAQFDLDVDERGSWNVTWLSKVPSEHSVMWMEQQIERLTWWDEHRGLDRKRPEAVPELEWSLVRNFHKALLTALQAAVEAVDKPVEECTSKDNDDNDDEKECPVPVQYDALQEEPDDLPYPHYTCDNPYSFPGYRTLDTMQSHYQNMKVYSHPETHDTCFDLDSTVQICGNYRPHYHEMMVHYTARYLPEVKRVVFVGGGDSMLLHEILKYDSLELVVGLELDQVVTRTSFKHFGTQPHWDHPKVQWWFGDAAKSLLMLPGDYFGSFDMVLMDLSETVMSMTVNDGLDIFGALALLLKPTGIIVKNEFYLETFSKIFDYTVQIHFDDVPTLCSQVFLLGSYGNNMLTQDPVDHGIRALYPAVHSGRYDVWHDFKHNETRVGQHCKTYDEPIEPVEQTRSPGILMILEAEEATKASPGKTKKSIVKALEQQGLHVISAMREDNIFTVILQEGYIVARLFPQHKYCAFDIHLISAFDKHEDVKQALLSSVGGSLEDASSYRVVAGGMFGVDTWRSDEKKRGPRYTHECESEHEEPTAKDGSVGQDTFITTLGESLALAGDKNIIVVVICGRDSEPCKSIDVISKSDKKVTKVIPLKMCAFSEVANEFTPDAGKLMQECQSQILGELESAVTVEGSKIRAMVVDDSAPLAMGQLVHKIFKRQANKQALLADDLLVTANIQGDSQSWRRNFLEKFRRDIIVHEPVFLAEVLFNSTDSSMEWGVMKAGDWDFVERLTEVVSHVEKKTGNVADVRNVQGGLYNLQPDFKPSVFALPSDYDQSGPLQQWNAQHPVGLQTVFQFEEAEGFSVGERVSVRYTGEEEWYDGTITKENSDGTFYVDFDDGDIDDAVDEKVMRHVTPKKKLSVSTVGHALHAALQALDLSKVQVHYFDNLGDGSLHVANWSQGSFVVLWDGRAHVDVNLFTYEEDFDRHSKAADAFRAELSVMLALKDENPRGFGRVVNFLLDLEPRRSPHWASSMSPLLSTE